MFTLTIDLDEHAVETLNDLAKNSGEPLSVVLEKAIESYRRRSFFEGLSTDVAKLRKNPEAWKEELDERAAWDAASNRAED